MAGNRVTIAVGDGTQMAMYVSRPSGSGLAPGILVFQEAWGVDGHIRDVADRFVRLGFIAAAPELFHRTAPSGTEIRHEAVDEARKHLGSLTLDGVRADVTAAHHWLIEHGGADTSRMACIGFCMGGRVSWIANTAEPFRAAISFYGGGIDDLLWLAPQQGGPILMFWGGQDSHIPPESRRRVEDALSAAGKTHEQVVFGQAGHAFFNDTSEAAYHANAARQAWALTTEFLRANEVIG
jgi:carboxymethylenebutenolidase